ncbi:hypothetical protein BDA99DRAFT_474946 [Phascolomyces articulosus]|uniref:Kinesin motor domain-containing protein n=1 Tax=Phascolomyces articulosus TaxID=60185 RepID=A0AAD5KPP0_9FUNG|nr:hypothetical protein BDA99DRAFT_474946 [Phascolomyces articulosus]
MAATAVRVGLRVRPLTQKEQLENCTECLSYVPNEPQILIGTDKSFTYDYVFDSNTIQSQVYSQAALPLLDKFMDGFNATILAYGQTGSGKTYSMGTGLHNTTAREDEGIVPRSMVRLFESMEQRAEKDPDFKYEIFVSFLELYNEELVDLLNPNTLQRKKGSNNNAPSSAEITIREDIAGNIYWSGVREERCSSPDELLGYLAKGSLCRTTGSTDMNTVSSRSHAIFSVILKQQQKEQDGSDKAFTSKFHYVDLAGSERLKRTNAQGDRAKEGIAINSGLLALGNVISALGDETRRATHVPYRDSKLTRLLQDSLGGNSQTLMLACVSPSDSNFMETLNTLKYANRARNIKNRVTINQDFAGSSIEINQLRAYIARLRMEIASLRASGATDGIGAASDSGENKALRVEIGRLRERIQDMSTNLIQVTSERDTLIMERELGDFLNPSSGLPDTLVAATGGAENASVASSYQEDHQNGTQLQQRQPSTSHPIITQYQKQIHDLTNELQDTRDRLAFLENAQPMAMQAMMMASSSYQKSGVTAHAGASASMTMSTSTSQRRGTRRSRRRHHMTPNSSNTTSVHTARVKTKHSARRPVLSQSSSTRVQRQRQAGVITPQYTLSKDEDEIRQEVRESIAKARQEIQKGMQVLDLAKPLDDAARDWEEELKEFEEHEKSLYGEKDIQRTSSDEGNFTPARSPTQEDDTDLLGNALLDEIETLAVPAWDGPDAERRKNEILVDDSSSSSNESTGGTNVTLPEGINNTNEKQNPQLARMLHQIQSDIRVKEELVSHLEKSENEYSFMKRKFDDRICQLQEQLLILQRERDQAMTRTRNRISSKSEITVQMKEKQHLIEIRHAYEAKMKHLLSQIQELKRKYSQTTMTMQATRNQNETLLRSLRVNVETLKVEKKRMIKRMKQEAERVREQSTLQERKIQQLQRLNAEATMARRRLERQHEQQRMTLKRRDEEVLMNNQQLKQLTQVLKKAVREGGVLDERLLSKMTPIIGGSFALIARRANRMGGDRKAMRKRMNKIPVQVRVTRKKQLLDSALYQFIQGKQAVVEMEQLLFRRERLAAEKLELIDERRHIYLAEKENAEATGQAMDTLALDFTDERIDLISAEISYLTARVRALQSEAAGDAIASSEGSDNGSIASGGSGGHHHHHPPQRAPIEKRVAFADDIINESLTPQREGDGWADMDAFEEQYSVPPSAAPETAYDVLSKLIKTLELDEAKAIAESLVEDIMNLRMSDSNRQVTIQNLEKTVHDLRRTLIVMKRAAITTTVENERRIRKLEEKGISMNGRRGSRQQQQQGGGGSGDDDSAIDVKIEEYINSGNTIFDKIYEDGIRGVVSTPEPQLIDSRRSSIASFGGGPAAAAAAAAAAVAAAEEALLPPPSPVTSPTYVTGSNGTSSKRGSFNGGVRPPVSLTDKNNRHAPTREATPSPDRFLNMIQRRLSWQQRMANGSESPIPFVMANPSEFARYSSDRESSTPSPVRNNHIRRSSMQSDHSSSQHSSSHTGSLRKRAYSLQQPPVPQRRRSSLLQQQQQLQLQQQYGNGGVNNNNNNEHYYSYEPQSPSAQPMVTMSYQQRFPSQQGPPRPPPLGPVVSASSMAMERAHSAGNVFDRLSQTPTRASRAKMAYRYSSGSFEELRQRWEVERTSSALSGSYQLPQ